MKKIILTFALTILLVFVGTTVLASSVSVTPKVTTSVTQLSEGGNLSVVLNVDQITFTSGINSINLKVKYDTEIFEQISSTSFETQNNWVSNYEPLSNELTLSRSELGDLQTEKGDVVKIDFKAKTGTSGKTTTVTLSDMVFWDGISAKFEASDLTTATVTIGAVTDIPPIIVDPDPTPDPDSNTTPTPVEQDKEIPDEIPETGLADNMIYIIAGLFILALGSYISYKKLERKNIRYVNVE